MSGKAATGCDYGMQCLRPDCPVHGKGAAAGCRMQAKDGKACPMHGGAKAGCAKDEEPGE